MGQTIRPGLDSLSRSGWGIPFGEMEDGVAMSFLNEKVFDYDNRKT